MEKALKILMLEDLEDDVGLIVRTLNKQGIQFTFIVKGVGRRSTLNVRFAFSTGTFFGVSKKRKPRRSSVAGERGVLRSRS